MPNNLRALIAKHFAGSRWTDTCNFYNKMPERYRGTICFHATLKKRHAMFKFEELQEFERELVVSAIDELGRYFIISQRRPLDSIALIYRLPLSVRKTLFLHAGLSAVELSLPLWHIKRSSCHWRSALLIALDEMLNIFDDLPVIITSAKPESYIQ
ncbi:replication protein B [Yersinia enterocolitica]|nr:replication protein B [Yersinia enterocolitica]EKN6025318.1 replication protein B [Yersinia enterocolitica]EKN6029636.1 replication protein B [Yersinia enterocolitica]ELW8241170.1 replication protein B [Yersinia enterocolitica]ELX2275047.1 replication protein B [Yersinia enterocolitica]